MNAPIPLTSEQPPKASESATVTLINVAELAKGNMDLIKCLMQTITNYQNTHGLCINGQGLTVCSNKPFELIISYKKGIVKKEISLRNHIDSAEGAHSEKYFHLYTWRDIQNLFTDQKFTLNKGDSIAIKLQFQDGACHEQLVVIARDLVNSLTVIANNPDHKLLRVFKDIQTLIDKPEHLAIALLNVLTLNPFYPQPFKLNADGTATLNVDARTAALTTFLLESLSITPTAQKLDKRAILKLTAPETTIFLNCLTAFDVHPTTDAAGRLQAVLRECTQQVIKPANPLAELDAAVIDAASTAANARAATTAAGARAAIDTPKAGAKTKPPNLNLETEIDSAIKLLYDLKYCRISYDVGLQAIKINGIKGGLGPLQRALSLHGISAEISPLSGDKLEQLVINDAANALNTLKITYPENTTVEKFESICQRLIAKAMTTQPQELPQPSELPQPQGRSQPLRKLSV